MNHIFSLGLVRWGCGVWGHLIEEASQGANSEPKGKMKTAALCCLSVCWLDKTTNTESVSVPSSL